MLLCGAQFLAAGQSSRDSVLLNERTIDRPIILHAGQFRVTGGYDLGVITRRFDLDGAVVQLRDEGTSYARHSFNLDVRYGIHRYVELALFTTAKFQSQRKRHYAEFTDFEAIELLEVERRNGIDGVIAQINLMPPVPVHGLDLVLTAGVELPASDAVPRVPNHEIEQEELAPDFTSTLLTYQYYPRWGDGVPKLDLGGAFKYRTANLALSGFADYRHAFRESESGKWRHQLVEGEFSYMLVPFNYFSQDELLISGQFAFQTAPWIVVTLSGSGFNAMRGWEEGEDGLKYNRPAKSFYSLGAGYEILVTPRIWLRQELVIPLAGQNDESVFGFNSSLVFNGFPF